MSFQPGSLDHVLADAVGGDATVAAELRALFLASATAHVAAMSEASGPEPWREEALKLQGLAATFGVTGLMQVAADAAGSGTDPALLDKVATALAGCR